MYVCFSEVIFASFLTQTETILLCIWYIGVLFIFSRGFDTLS